jgi:hypothetical protein
MPDIKVSELPEIVSLDPTDLLMAVHLADGPDGSKKITVGNARIALATRYTHVQGSASTTWVIPHNLGIYPAVTVVNSAGDLCEGEVRYDNANQVTLTFGAPFSGTAYLN